MKYENALDAIAQHRQHLDTMDRGERHARAQELLRVILDGAGLDLDDL